MGLIGRLRHRLSGDGAFASGAAAPALAPDARAVLVRGLALAARDWANAILRDEPLSGPPDAELPVAVADDPDGPPPEWLALVQQLRADRTAAGDGPPATAFRLDGLDAPAPQDEGAGSSHEAARAERAGAAATVPSQPPGETREPRAAATGSTRAFRLPSPAKRPRLARPDSPFAEGRHPEDARAGSRGPAAEGGGAVGPWAAGRDARAAGTRAPVRPAAHAVESRPARGDAGFGAEAGATPALSPSADDAHVGPPNPLSGAEGRDVELDPVNGAGGLAHRADAAARPADLRAASAPHPMNQRWTAPSKFPPPEGHPSHPRGPSAAPLVVGPDAGGHGDRSWARQVASAFPADDHATRGPVSVPFAIPGATAPPRSGDFPSVQSAAVPRPALLSDSSRSATDDSPRGATGTSFADTWAPLPPPPSGPADEAFQVALAESARRARLDREQRGA